MDCEALPRNPARGRAASLGLEGGEPLPKAWRDEVGAALSCNLSEVRLHRSASAVRRCRDLGTLGLSVGNEILVDEETADRSGTSILELLAHECAHYVQGRNRLIGQSASRAELEEEAEFATRLIRAGIPYRPKLARNGVGPLFWGCTGHFLTTYLVYLNFRAAPDFAFEQALFCWLPDQVKEFDAYHLYKKVYLDIALYAENTVIPPHARRSSPIVAKMNEHAYMKAMHVGLHCLTGGSASEEQRFRRGVLTKKSPVSNIVRGLAHHPLGDSFAHVEPNGKTMYRFGLGHGLHGHGPDSPWESNRRNIYKSYIQALFSVAQERIGGSPTLSYSQFILALHPIFKADLIPVVGLAPAGGVAISVAAASLYYDQKAKESLEFTELRERSALIDANLTRKIEALVRKTNPIRSDEQALPYFRDVAREILGSPMNDYNPIRDPVFFPEYLEEHKSVPSIAKAIGGGGRKAREALFRELFDTCYGWSTRSAA